MNSVKFFLIIAMLFLSSIFVITTVVRYENKINKLETIIDTLNQEIECNNSMLDFNNKYQEELEHQLDSLQKRYRIFNTEPGSDFIDIMNAIMQVESSGNADAYNKSEDAVGILQIRQCMVDDINRIQKRKNKNIFYTYDDRWCVNKSSEMFEIFCKYYGLETGEQIARCWNGGPRGINNPYTLGYWNKVELELEESYASR
tara:strand:+ start:337 stop:939 length:603 start_codon:yes stop_codon:yes gene_type:complete